MNGRIAFLKEDNSPTSTRVLSLTPSQKENRHQTVIDKLNHGQIMTAMRKQVKITYTQMQLLRQETLITGANEELATIAARIAVRNNKILAATFSAEKFFTVRRIIICSI